MPSDPIKVLYVEDNPVDARLTTSRLGEGAGFAFTLVEDLRHAVDRLACDRFDVVLLDLMLPDSRGLCAVDQIHERHADMPIVVLTGFGAEDHDLACEALRGGAQEFLAKGAVDPLHLGRTLERAIARKQQENRRLRNARQDEVTGLANRVLIEERFERAAARAERTGRGMALLVIEVDRFTDLALEHGADLADRLLRCLAQRLGSRLRRVDTLARMRRRGFTALVEGLRRPGDALRLAGRLLTAVAQPLELEGEVLRPSASIGCALWQQGIEFEDLVHAAERAMLQAAESGGNAACDGSLGLVPAGPCSQGVDLSPLLATGRPLG